MKRGLDNEKGSAFLMLFTLLLLLLILLGFSYFLYLNLPGSPENLQVDIDPTLIENLSSQANQFFPNMKFNHNVISYDIDKDCEVEKQERMVDAFNRLSDVVEIVTFFKSTDNPDIIVSCSESDNLDSDEKHFIAGEGGAKEVVKTGKFNVITNGVILLYDNEKFSKCEWPNVELHELLHVFGFDHNSNENSLMFPVLTNCDQKIDSIIVSELIRLYSLDNLADLYFDELSAVKKGRYLDFNLTVKNSGVVNAEDVKLSILDEGELVETRDLEDISYGAGIIIKIQNFKLLRRNPDEISFVIDLENKIKELDKKNNIANINFS